MCSHGLTAAARQLWDLPAAGQSSGTSKNVAQLTVVLRLEDTDG